MSDGRDAAPSEYKRIAPQFAGAKARKAPEDSAEATNKFRERQFKASHAFLLIFLSWILYVSGVQFSVTLLTRLVVFTPLVSTSLRKASSSQGLSSTSNQNAPCLQSAFLIMTLILLKKDAGIRKLLIKPL